MTNEQKNKCLVIAADIFPPDIGGPATYSGKLAAALVRSGWKVKLICYSDKKQKDNYDFPVFRIRRGRFAPWRYLKYFLKLKQLAKDADVIYAMGPVAAGWPALRAAKSLGKKLVVKIVGDYAWEQARNLKLTDLEIDEFQTKKWGGKIGRLKRIETKVCQKADKVITPSEYLKKIVMGWGVEGNKIEVIYNAYHAEDIGTPESVDKNLIVSVGRLVPWKGFDALISIMPDLLKENKNFRLLIFGSGPERDKLIGLVNKLSLHNVVSFELVSHLELMKKLSAAGIFVLSTRYEGLSHTILEAMAVGVAVVTTNIGGNPELIEGEHGGLLVDYNNKEQIKESILRLYHNPELRQKLINNSKEVLKKFTFEKMINKTEELLRNL